MARVTPGCNEGPKAYNRGSSSRCLITPQDSRLTHKILRTPGTSPDPPTAPCAAPLGLARTAGDPAGLAVRSLGLARTAGDLAGVAARCSGWPACRWVRPVGGRGAVM
ncbi:hypothetical protein GCM10023259_037870 [Thermocatellispora tengchongensis]